MTVLFRPCGDLSLAPTPRDEHDAAFYASLSERTGIAITTDASVDYEDWMEPACMLEAMLDLGLEVKILPRMALTRAVANPVATIPGEPCRDVLIGRQINTDRFHMKHFDLGWPSADDMLPSRYTELTAFTRNAGRLVQLADMPGDPEHGNQRELGFSIPATSTSLGEAMSIFAGSTAVVKQVWPVKALPLLRIPVSNGISYDEAQNLFLDEVGFHFARFEGDKGSLLVQEEVVMTHETRFFVIEGRLVCGAPCVESDTPRQHVIWDGILPRRWELKRNSGEMDTRPPAEREGTALAMWTFAEQVVTEIRSEAPEMKHYVLDLALGEDGAPLVVELNPAANSGLYAQNLKVLAQAIMSAAETAPHREPVPMEDRLTEAVADGDEGLDSGEGVDGDALWAVIDEEVDADDLWKDATPIG